tara:strand:- start:297 stop:536 length:240 start_codon:yes stop_codon:yes gene_type:complete
MNNWKDILKDENLTPQVRAKLMDVYRNLYINLKNAVKELEKHGHSLNGASDMLYELNANWEDLKPEEFGFGNRGTKIDE